MRFKLLGKSGLRVSELALGTMTIGNDWGWGAEKPVARKIFEAFVEAGSNFIDTANNYTDGSSKRFVSEFVGQEREQFVTATKYTLHMTTNNPHDPNGSGNSRKAMQQTMVVPPSVFLPGIRSVQRFRGRFNDICMSTLFVTLRKQDCTDA